jgi:hypothetical protein
MNKAKTASRNRQQIHFLTVSVYSWECNNDLETCLRKQRIADKDARGVRSFAVWSIPGDSSREYGIDPQMGPMESDSMRQLEGAVYIGTIFHKDLESA